MAGIDLKPLVGRLNDPTRRALEASAGLTLSRSHYNIELEHVLLSLADRPDNDLAAILRHYEIDVARILPDLQRALDGMKTGNARAPSLSPDIVDLMKQAWVFASVELGASRVRSGHLVWAMLTDDRLARRASESSDQWAIIQPEALKKNYDAICQDSIESAVPAETTGSTPAARPNPGTAALDQFTIDLTAQARAGKVDPILGRDLEIRQMVDILTRRRQNNPILTGEAGVGKTAVVEGFALRLATGDVPPSLKDVTLRTLDLGLLQAGAGVKGEFENRLRSVMDEVKASPKPIILFIDEAHQLIGAGGSAGQGDAANLLKPALARGELRTIAATTWAEYKKYFEKDAALTRRFQVVKVEEPTEPVAVAMIRGLVATLEKHHKVRILDEAVSEAVRLSARYIPARQLPDKAVSLIDTACARVAMSQAAIPAPVEDRRRRISLIDTELAIIAREEASGADHTTRREALTAEREANVIDLAALEARWEQEKALNTDITAIRTLIDDGAPAEPLPDAEPFDAAALRAQLTAANARLRTLQGEQPLIFPVVDGQAVAEIVQSWTGIPAGRMQSDEVRTVLNLRATMEERVIGQSHALEAVAQAIRTSRAGLTDPRKPIGVFLMVGTSGTGKTETALTLADLLYGGEQNLTTINMTEFKEEHKVSLLMGSPPGYVGYGEGGILTEAVRRRPYSVILLDEMEKAHPGVQDVFFQVFDKGNMKDGEGRDIDFKNTVIIMTSNAATDTITALFADPDTAPDPAALAEAIRPELGKYFKPAFLGRVTIVPYVPLSDEVIRMIVGLQLKKIAKRVHATYAVAFTWDPAVVDAIAARCTESSSGARNVENILTRTLLPELSAEILARLGEGQPVGSVAIGLTPDGAFTYAIENAAPPPLAEAAE